MPRELTIFDFGWARVDAEHIGDLDPAVFSSAARQSFVTGVAQGRGRAILCEADQRAGMA